MGDDIENYFGQYQRAKIWTFHIHIATTCFMPITILTRRPNKQSKLQLTNFQFFKTNQRETREAKMSDVEHKQDTKSYTLMQFNMTKSHRLTKCRASAARASFTTKGPARRKAKNSSEEKLLNPTKRKLKIRRPGRKCKVKIFDEVGDALNHASFNWMKATRDKCSGSGNVYISYYDEDDEECEISDLEDVETAFECGHEMFHISSGNRASCRNFFWIDIL